MRHRVHELGEFGGQREVPAVAHAGDRRAQDRAAGLAPVVQAFDARVVALVEGVGEEVGQEPALGVLHAGDVGDHAGGGAVADRADHGVQPQVAEAVLIGFGADPLVAEEHHGLLAGGVGFVDQALDVRAHEVGKEVDPVALCLAGHAPGGVVAARVHEVLGAQPVAVPSLEVVERLRGDGAGAAEPVDHLLAVPGVEQEGELVEERGEAYHVGLGAVLEPPGERVEHEVPGLLVVDVERDLVFLVSPVVGQVVVHLHRIPDDVGQERGRVFVHRGCVGDGDRVGGWIVGPVGGVDDFAGCAVDDLPVPVRVGVAVGLQLLLVEAVHQRDRDDAGFGQDPVGEQVDLRGLVHMQGDPLVVGAGREVGAVHLLAQRQDGLVQVGAVGVADGVGAPQVGELLGLFGEVLLAGDGETSGRHGTYAPLGNSWNQALPAEGRTGRKGRRRCRPSLGFADAVSP